MIYGTHQELVDELRSRITTLEDEILGYQIEIADLEAQLEEARSPAEDNTLDKTIDPTRMED